MQSATRNAGGESSARRIRWAGDRGLAGDQGPDDPGLPGDPRLFGDPGLPGDPALLGVPALDGDPGTSSDEATIAKFPQLLCKFDTIAAAAAAGSICMGLGERFWSGGGEGDFEPGMGRPRPTANADRYRKRMVRT